ncbi:MAG: hypothetical protein ABEN55_01060 [Bradymonadaceae bacterium]
MKYYETIQQCFTELTRRAIFLSGRDLQLLSEWRDQGATAAAVCKGLREAVEAMPDDDPPRDVYACRHYVEPYVERAGQRQVGGHEDGGGEADTAIDLDGAPELVVRALERVEEAGRSADDEAIKRVYRRVWRDLRHLCEDDGETGNDADGYERLAAIEEALVDGYYRALDRRDQARIESAIKSESAALLDKMSPEARSDHLRARRRRILREHFDMVSLFD